MTSNPHTELEHNRPSRFRDTEARCGGISARAHVQSVVHAKFPQVHAKFQRNRPSRYRETAGGTFVTSPQVERATCHNVHCHDSSLVPCTAEGILTKEDRLSIGLTVPEI